MDWNRMAIKIYTKAGIYLPRPRGADSATSYAYGETSQDQ
jgi:hypothetical protein